LIGHGFLRGYAERDSEVVVRGRRVFCSNRARRTGCGRTFSVRLATVLAGFLVRTLTLWRFANAVVGGLTRRAGWLLVADGALSLSSGYRCWRRLSAAQSALRTRLWREAPAPASVEREPIAHLLAHIGVVFPAVERTRAARCWDPLAAFQLHLQRGLFER
jgi:hypothetical protein